MVVLAFLSDPTVVAKILIHLKLPASPPPLVPARVPEPEELLPPAQDDDGNQDPAALLPREHTPARGPP